MEGCSFGPYMVLIQNTPMTTPSAPMTKNPYAQPKSCAIQPISGAKITVAKYCPELKKADAVPRSLPGNHAATMRALAGNEGASANPTRSRNRNSTVTAVAPEKNPTHPCSSVNSDQ